MLTAIRQYVLRKMMKDQTGVMRTLPRKDIFDFNVAMTAERLMRNGIDPNALKNANQVENAINQVESAEKANLAENIRGGIRQTETGKVFDLKGKEIKNPKNIMGGEELKETDEAIKARLEKGNKEGIARIKNRQKMLDDAIDDASPGFSGDRKVDAELVAENLAERMGLVYDDLPTKQRLDIYDQAYTGLSKQRFKNRKKPDDADSQESSYDDGPADFDPDADNETFAQGGRAGFFLGSANPKGLGLLRAILKNMSKKGKELDKFKGADLSALDMLRLSNPKRFNRLLEDVRGKVNVKEGIMGTDTVRAMQQTEREKRKGLTEAALNVAKEMKAKDDAIRRRIAEEAEYTIIPRTKKMMMEGMGMSEEAAEKAARDMAEAAQNMRLIDDSPIITKEGLLQLENVLKNMETGGKKARELNATGGRIGFKDGMTRRTFLKILGGVMSIPIIGKIVKPLKLATGVKKVPIIKTDNVPGKPEWFDQLVNKVIIEGDDVTKRFATGERQSIHQKTLDDGSVVRVTEDVDDGAVRVEYESEKNVFGDDVMLQYKKSLPDEGDPNPSARFDVAESGPVGRVVGPDDMDIEIDEVGGQSIRDLDSDVSKLKEYATGKKLTMKEILESKKRRDKAAAITDDIDGAQSDAIVRRQGDYDPSDYDDGMASGGIAGMLGE